MSSGVHGGGAMRQSYNFGGGEGWAGAEGTGWSVGTVEGVYRITVEPNYGNIWSYRTLAGDSSAYSLEVDVQVDGGAGGPAVHFVDGNSYVVFFVEPASGAYWLERHIGGVGQVVVQGQSGAIARRAQATNRLMVEVDGEQARLFVNGTQVSEATLTGIGSTGQFGLVAVATSGSTTARFDNLTIRDLPR